MERRLLLDDLKKIKLYNPFKRLIKDYVQNQVYYRW